MYGKIQLDDVTKKKLSLLLKYYRKKAKLNQKEFITYNHATICSADTYSRIENQKIIKSNSIYHYLLYQMQAQLNIEPAYWKDFTVCWQRILELVTRYDIARLQTTIQNIITQFPKQEDILKQEHIALLTIIADYYANCSELREEDFQKYRQLYPIFDPSLQEIIKDMLYTYTVHRQRTLKQITAIYEELHIAESSASINILNRCYQAFYEDRFLDCFKDSLWLEEQFLQDKNYNRLLDVYDAIVLLYAQLQKGKQNREYEQKLFALLNEHKADLHPNKYLQAIYQCGMLYLENGCKEEACTCFCELAQKDDYHYLPAALFACILKDELKESLPETILRDPRYPERFPKHVRTFHRYYQRKHNQASLEELETFLCEKVFPLLSDDDELLKKSASDELHQLVRKSGHYYLKKRI